MAARLGGDLHRRRELWAERVLLFHAVDAEDVQAAHLLDLRLHGELRLGVPAPPGVVFEVDGGLETEQGDDADGGAEVGGEAGDDKGQDVGAARAGNESGANPMT